ncbi:MAG: RagB/SusD family nutrient uptake outer membrane protein [Saprospiraceae bacterium]|nr:RagB/SusD family nutrient uptake outer membrane protein [Saprospiraceae bacterium]
MKRKNIITIEKSAFVVLLFLSLAACEKDFLERNPIIGSTLDNYYKTESDAVAAINATYATLQFEMTPAGHFRWFWGDIMSDDAVKGGSGDNDQPQLAALENFQGPTNTEYLEAEWAADYEGIYRANVVLEKVPAIEMNEQLKARILGEAHFIRAWFFYNLVTIFGGVPLADHVLAPSEYNMPKASAEEVWALVEADLRAAAASLPVRSGYPASQLGRITKGAAQALLVKTLLWKQNWAEAKTIAEEIINSGEYTLVPEYKDIFTTAGENNSESLFEIQYMSESGGNWGYNSNNEGTFANVFQRARGQFEGYGFNIPTQDFVDEFFKEGFEDPRLSSTVFREGDQMGDRGLFTKEAVGGVNVFDFYPKKFFNNKAEEASFGDPNPNGGTNDRVIRYSDVLLMHAEASYHAGNEGAARQSLNLVRDRVKILEVTATGPALLDAIYHERRVELGLEGHRFFDLVRSGRAVAALGGLGYVDNIHRVLPIPQSQIQATNGALVQNPGY